MITKLVGALVKGSQSLKIEPGMIAAKKARNGGDIFAAHCQCIEYVAVLFDEGVLMSELSDTMQTIRGYNIGLHESLKEAEEFLETGPNSADEKMIELQNVMVSTPSTNPRTVKEEGCCRAGPPCIASFKTHSLQLKLGALPRDLTSPSTSHE